MNLGGFSLPALGWREQTAAGFRPYMAEDLVPGRIALEHKHMYRVYTELGELLAEVSGKFRHEAARRSDYPAVGDWVALRVREGEGRATIRAVLPRHSAFVRKAAGPTEQEQLVAANVDTVFLVQSLNLDFNVRRLERYLTVAWESGAEPVVVLSKADQCADTESRIAAAQAAAPGVPVHAVSSLTGDGIDALRLYLGTGRTAALLGSSGAGKSTLANLLCGREALKTGGIREGDDRGRHTTTHRELVPLPSGGLLIDTPGMRELQLWEASDGLDAAFADVEGIAAACRFADCRHGKEPGCAVQAALAEGTLDEARYYNYVKLQKELAFQARKENKQLQQAEKARWKKIHREMRDH